MSGEIMFWEKEYTYEIIDDTISISELQEFLRNNSIFLDIIDNSTAWCAFAQYYGRTNGLNDIESASFSFIISTFMSPMGVSAGTEVYYKEENIELKVIDIYTKLQEQDINEEDKVKQLFNEIFLLYRNDIEEYSWKNRRLQLRISESDYEKFHQLPGKTITDKFRNLLRVQEQNTILTIFNTCPASYYKDINDFRQHTLNVFDEMEYRPNMDKFDWAIREAEKYGQSNSGYIPTAEVIRRVYCLLENIRF